MTALKRPVHPMTTEVEQALEASDLRAAYDARPAYQRNDYLGWIDSTTRRLDADRHTVLFSRRKPRGTWSRSNKERVERLIGLGLMTPAGLAVIDAARADGSWSSLDDVEALVVPDDLSAALAAEPAAAARWGSASASQRKIALYRIASAKRQETRTRRVSEVVRAAAEGRTLWT